MGEHAASIKPEILQRVRSVFSSKATDGALDEATFRRVMQDLGLQDLPMQRIFEMMDVDRSGTVSVDELVGGLDRIIASDRLRAIFDLYDRDCDGKVSVREVVLMLRLTRTSSVLLEQTKFDRMAEFFGKMIKERDERKRQPGPSDAIEWDDFRHALETSTDYATAFLVPNRYFRDYVTREQFGGESQGATKLFVDAHNEIANKTAVFDQGLKSSGEQRAANNRNWLLAIIAIIVFIVLAIRIFDQSKKKAAAVGNNL